MKKKNKQTNPKTKKNKNKYVIIYLFNRMRILVYIKSILKLTVLQLQNNFLMLRLKFTVIWSLYNVLHQAWAN